MGARRHRRRKRLKATISRLPNGPPHTNPPRGGSPAGPRISGATDAAFIQYFGSIVLVAASIGASCISLGCHKARGQCKIAVTAAALLNALFIALDGVGGDCVYDGRVG